MQFAKDTFFLTLRERLAALNPARVVTVNGATVPAIVVTENLPPRYGEPAPNTFYIEWGVAELDSVQGWGCGLTSLEVAISYYSFGSVQSLVDRGRLLGQLDFELLSICQPPNAEKRDYTQSPSTDLGTRIFWTQPTFPVGDSARKHNSTTAAESHQDARVERKARLKLYFFPEVSLS